MQLLKEIIKKNIAKNAQPNEGAHTSRCDLCGRTNFVEYRYKCLVCDDYDLCGVCFEKRQVNKTHQLSHPLVRFEQPDELFGLKFKHTELNIPNLEKIFKNETHDGVKCDCCQMQPLKGLRFKCDTCHDYDLCLNCFKAKKTSMNHSITDHPLIVQGKNTSLSLDADDIELQTLLGKGGFGAVYKARLKSLDKIVACKVINTSKEQPSSDRRSLVESYMRELEAYKELKGVNILRMFGHSVQVLGQSTNFMLITELMSKGSLASLLEKEKDLSKKQKFDIVCGIAAGIARIHEHNFIHRDIRPDNILIADDYTAKIADMGIAKILSPYWSQNTLVGCLPYMPPEFYTGKYDQKLDVFTFGLTVNIVYGGNHVNGPPVRVNRKAEILQEVVNKCVDLEATKRPTSRSIAECFRIMKKAFDEFLLKGDFYNTYNGLSNQGKNEVFDYLYKKLIEENMLLV